jgi:sirohydrochlorin ferrochelatase
LSRHRINGEHFKWVALALLLVCLAYATTANTTESAQKPPRRGILLMAHGGRIQQWNEEVRHVADRTDLEVPTEIAFGMATRSTLDEGIRKLVARNVTEVVAVPLFVSSHSSVIDSTAYLLGLRKDMPEDLKMFASMDHGAGGHSMDHGDHQKGKHKNKKDATKPIQSTVPVHITPALDHHQIVADILVDRAASISADPSKEVVVLVAHGPVEDHENELWLQDMRDLADKMKTRTKYAGIEFLTLRDDADDPVRSNATKQLRAVVEKINKGNQNALVVPLLLSFGGIEDGLKERLSGLTYKITSQGLLPDNRISDWVLQSAKSE